MRTMKLLVAVAVLILSVSFSYAQSRPNCDVSCGGGIQPTNTGGDAIQTWTSISNQRGVGSAKAMARRAGTVTRIEGSQSYTHVEPLFALAGRNLGLNLAVYYNSLLWQHNSENNSMVYAADFQLSPGFTLGYGAIDFSTDLAVGMLTEPTGARHLLVSSTTTANQYNTTDSSYIQVQYPANTGSPAIAAFKDGLRVFYQPFTVLVNGRTQYRPYQVEDTNGNLISIVYADPNDLLISTITDTVGRVIKFTYDSTGKMLQTVAQLDNSGNVFRQYTFSWQSLTLTFNFTLQATAGLGLAPGVYTSGTSTVNVINKITRPDGTAVVFDYLHDGSVNGNADWGIVKSINELSTTGALRLRTSYVFPAASAGQLTRNPTYSEQFDSNGRTWLYQATVNSQGLVTSSVTTDPCGQTLTSTFSSAGNALDGLPLTEVLATPQTPTGSAVLGGCPSFPATKTWSTVSRTWTADTDGSNPRPQTVTSTLDDGTSQSQIKFNSYDSFGQVTDLLQYDLGNNAPGPLLREVVTSYTSVGNGIVNRPGQIIVKNGSGATVSRTDFAYDNYGTAGLANITSNPVQHDPAFGTSTTVRGNLTGTTVYSNAAAAGGAITSTFTYDIAGNRLTSQSGCCTFSGQIFSSATNYSLPDSITTGPSGNALSLTSNFSYDMLRGQVATSKDANGQTTSIAYDIDSRPTTTTLPDTSTVTRAYDDSSVNLSSSVSNSFNSLVTTTTINGLTVSDQVQNGSAVVSTKTTTVDSLGRTISVSNPFGPTDTPIYTTYVYDPLGRVTQVAPPGNTGSYANVYGIENTTIDSTTSPHMVVTVTSTDPAGKQRKRYTDGLGLRQVDEPGETGGQAGSGSISISGTDQSVSVANGGGATAGTGSVTISGAERSTVVLTHAATPASVTVTIGGSNSTNTRSVTSCTGGPPSRLPLNCRTSTTNFADSGTIQFSVNVGGTVVGPVSVSYNASSSTSGLAAGLAGAVPSNGVVGVSYTSGSSSFTLTTIATGSAMNGSSISTSVATSCVDSSTTSDNGTGSSTSCAGPAWTITPSQNFSGGTDNVNTTMYDTGNATVSVTINGTVYSKSSAYGQNSNSTGIATDLANQINADTTLNKLLIANASSAPCVNGILCLTTSATGNGTNYPLSVGSVTNSPYFLAGSTSFPASPSGSTLTPGQNGTIYDTGTVKVTITGFTATPYSVTANYRQGSTPASILSSLAGALNGDPLSPVKCDSSTGALTARVLGAETNYGVQVTPATTQPAYFSQASFTGSAVSLSGGQDPVASLSTPLSTTYFYDPMGRLLQINQGLQQRVYAYDDLGRLTSAKIPETLNQATTYSYTDFGGVFQKTDPRGTVTTNSYDALNRLSQISFNDNNATPTVQYTYGDQSAANFGVGRLTKVVDGSGTTTFQYDLMGRRKQASQAIGSQTYTISYSYTNEQLDTITYPSGRTVKITPDAIGRLNKVDSNGSNLLTVASYNAAGQLLGATYGNGMTATYTYNNQLQLASLVSGSSTTPVLNLTYDYGSQNNGQIQGITDGITPSQSTGYTYDELGRLKTAQTNDLTSSNTWKLRFSYDRYGNRLSEVGEAGTSSLPFNEATADPVSNRITNMQYDAAGNLANDGLHAYTYNAENQITQVDGAGAFVYNSGGRRVKKNGTIYVYDRGQVIAEYANGSAANSPTVEYVGQIARFAGGVTTFYYPDKLSIRALANISGQVTGKQAQFPYGEIVIGLQSGVSTKSQFTSYERDTVAGDSGLDYALARFYDSRIGRFASVDPLSGSISDPQSLNRYAYVTNDPINFDDPTGMAGAEFVCLLNELGDCVGGNYNGWNSNATAGAESMPDAFGRQTCSIDGFAMGCGWVSVLSRMGDIARACPDNDCSLRYDSGIGWHQAMRTGQDGSWQVFVPWSVTPIEDKDGNFKGWNIQTDQWVTVKSSPSDSLNWFGAAFLPPAMNPTRIALAAATRILRQSPPPNLLQQSPSEPPPTLGNPEGAEALEGLERYLHQLMEGLAAGMEGMGDIFITVDPCLTDLRFCKGSKELYERY